MTDALTQPPTHDVQLDPTQMPSLQQQIGHPATPQQSYSWLSKLGSLLALGGSWSKTSTTDKKDQQIPNTSSKSGVIVKMNPRRRKDSLIDYLPLDKVGPDGQKPMQQYHVTNIDEMKSLLETQNHLNANDPVSPDVVEFDETVGSGRGVFGFNFFEGSPDPELSPVFEEEVVKTSKESHPKVTGSWIELHLGQASDPWISENSSHNPNPLLKAIAGGIAPSYSNALSLEELEVHTPIQSESLADNESTLAVQGSPYARSEDLQATSDYIVQMSGADSTMENIDLEEEGPSSREAVSPNATEDSEGPSRIVGPSEQIPGRTPIPESMGSAGRRRFELDPIPRLFDIPTPRPPKRGKPVIMRRSKKK